MVQSTVELKSQVCQAIEANRERILALAEDVLRHPELGYKEHRTADLVQRTFRDLGLPYEAGLAITGVKALLPGASPGPTVAILGELDALFVPDHPFADASTGAAHACGHFAQIGMMLAAAIGFVEAGIAPKLAGRLAFMAVPAEESVEVEWRLAMRDEGKLEFLGGKQELIKLGAFDDVDMAMMTHSSGSQEARTLALGGGSNGHVIKHAHFSGRAAHAGSSPHLGINALKAAMLGLAAIDAQRETFKDDDAVRIHPIITKGGDVVNAVPADVRLETFVRARTLEAIEDANAKVDRALRAGALAMGARLRITNMPGYLPIQHEPHLVEIYRANAVDLVGEDQVSPPRGHGGHGTDAGDLSQILPVVHPSAGGGIGNPHGKDFVVKDYEAGIIAPAKAMAMTAIDLLADDAARGRAVLREYKPLLSKEEYLTFVRRMAYVRDYEES